MARPMSGPELTKVRSNYQSSSLYLLFKPMPTVYTAHLNGVPSSNDSVIQIGYNTGVGTLGNVKPGMTMFVGTTAGAYDVGMVRIRTAPDGSFFYIGETSEIDWGASSPLYLTVVDDFGIWQRNLILDTSNVPFMDSTIAYTDQHTNYNPVPVLGPRLIPVWLTGAYVDIPLDSTLTWVPGSTITGHSWVASGGTLTGGSTSTPNLRVTTTGLYRLDYTATAANGKTTTAYQYVRVFSKADMPVNQFVLDECSGSWSRGGWEFKVTLYDQASFSSVVDRTMVVLFAKDYYAASEGSVGPVAGAENIIALGWIQGETITEDPEGSYVQFTVQGANAWIANCTGFPIGIENVSGTPTAWTQASGLTVDLAVYHLLYWQSTVIPTIDVTLTGDTKLASALTALGELTLWDQIKYLAYNSIVANPLTDRFGRFFLEVDANLTPVADRGSIPVVLTLQKIDWKDHIQFNRYPTPTTSRTDLSGVVIASSNFPTAIYSLSPGHAFKHWGKSKHMDKLLLTTQAQANELAGMIVAMDNKLRDFSLDLSGNNRFPDITPKQFVGITILAADNPRGDSYSGNTLPREIQIKQETDGSNFLSISWKLDQETFPENSTIGDTPTSSTSVAPPALPPSPKLPPLPVTLPIGPQPNFKFKYVFLLTQVGGLWYTANFGDTSPNWYSLNGNIAESLSSLWQMLVTPAGNIYLMDSAGIYFAQVGGTQPIKKWDLVYLRALLGGGGGSDIRYTSIGYNPSANDQVAFTGGTGFFSGNNMHIAVGGAGGFVLGHIQGGSGWSPNYVSLSYGNGKWILWYSDGTLYARRIGRFTLDGVTLEADYSVTEDDGSGAADFSSRQAGLGETLFFWTNGHVVTSVDNGDTRALLSNAGPGINDINGGFDSAPDGLNLMETYGTLGTLKISSDGGATWGSTSFPLGQFTVKNLGDSLHWLVAGNNTVYYTDDGGTTYTDKGGNIHGYLPTFRGRQFAVL